MEKERFWNIPNILSLSRIFLAIMFAFLLFDSKVMIAVIFLILASLTDLFDGYLARRLGQVSRTGAILDQISDKLSMLIITIAIFSVLKVPGYIFLILIRDFFSIIFGGLIYIRKGIIVKASLLGKSITAMQFITLIMIFINQKIAFYLIIITIIWTIITLIDYSPRFAKEIRR